MSFQRIRALPTARRRFLQTLLLPLALVLGGCATSRQEARSPIGMQHEMGHYRKPDVVLNGVDEPKSRTNRDCGEHWVIYAVNLQPGDCESLCPIPPLQCIPCSISFERAADYFQNRFQCGHERCKKKVGEIIWFGWSCHKDTRPPLETMTCAMEIEVWCEPEL